MPVWIFEILILGWATWVAVRIVRNGLAANLLELGSRMIALIVAMAGSATIWLIAPLLTANPVSRMTFTSVGVAVVYLPLSRYLIWRTRRNGRASARRLSERLGIGHRLDRISGFILCGFFVLALSLMADLAGQTIAVTSQRDFARDTSIALHLLMPDEIQTHSQQATNPSIATDDHDPLSYAEASQLQTQLFAGLRNGVRQSRDYVYDTTGLTPYLEQIKALQQIISMSDEEKDWVIANNPAILALLEHAAIQRIAFNERIPDLIERVGNGSIPALYELGDEPDIQNLIADPTIQEVVGQIDLIAIVNAVEAWRTRGKR